MDFKLKDHYIRFMNSYHIPPEHYYKSESDRLLFREFTPDDIVLWTPFFEDKPVQRFLGGNSKEFAHLNNEERATKWISRQIDRKTNKVYGQLAVIEKETGKFLGVGGLISRLEEEEETFGELEVTYSLLPEARGKGYAKELAVHFKNWALENTDIPSVISLIHVENEASMNVARNNGMKNEKEIVFFEMPIYVFRAER